MGLKDKIKAAQDIQKELVTILDWDNVQIEVRTISARQRSKLFSTATDKQGNILHDKFHAAMLVASCYDPETTEKLFDDGDVSWLMDKAAGPLEVLVNVAMRLSGLNKEVMKEQEKNS
jgi:hypothetical protein